MNEPLPAALQSPVSPSQESDSTSLLDLAIPLAERWKLLACAPMGMGLLALAITYVIAPTFTARMSFLPPQQQQSAAASALASLGALSGLSGAGTRTSGDQYVALLQSSTIEDRLIDKFDLMAVYGQKYRVDTRKALERNVRIAFGKKDGLITVEVDDHSAERAALIANQHLEELRHLTSKLALTEAQQRRVLFEAQMKSTRQNLTDAQISLQASGFDANAIRAEPRAAADGYARLKAELTAAEVTLQTIRQTLTDAAPEVQQQQAKFQALRAQLAQFENKPAVADSSNYIGKYREFKYQEALFELFSRQYELARLDESREGALMQVVDAATIPEVRSKPRRATTVIATAFSTGMLLAIGLLVRHFWRQSAQRDPSAAAKLHRLKAALRGR